MFEDLGFVFDVEEFEPPEEEFAEGSGEVLGAAEIDDVDFSVFGEEG